MDPRIVTWSAILVVIASFFRTIQTAIKDGWTTFRFLVILVFAVALALGVVYLLGSGLVPIPHFLAGAGPPPSTVAHRELGR